MQHITNKRTTHTRTMTGDRAGVELEVSDWGPRRQGRGGTRGLRLESLETGQWWNKRPQIGVVGDRAGVELEASDWGPRRQGRGGTRGLRLGTVLTDTELGPWWQFWKRRRYVLAILVFISLFNLAALGASMGAALVAMTTNYSIDIGNGTTLHVRDLDWDMTSRGAVECSFLYGSLLSQVPGGWLAGRVGAHRLLGLGVASAALLALFVPALAYSHVSLLVALRVFQGILQVGHAFLWRCTSSRGFYRWGMLSCGAVLLSGDSTGGVCFLVEMYFFQGILQGVTLPCINALWSRWAPPLERSQLATLALSGSYVGTAVSVPLSGAIADGIGWPAIFYVFGAILISKPYDRALKGAGATQYAPVIPGLLGLVWFVVWWMLVKECPERDPHISVEELKYIQNSLGPQEKIYKATIHPWREILTSLPFWAITVAHFVEVWGFHSLINQLPDFVKDTSGSFLKRDGFLAVLPFLVTAGLMQLSGQVADWLLATGFTMATIIRKLYICGAFLGEAVLLIVLVFLNTASGVIVCVSLASAFQACTWAALSVNHLELAPRHAGVLMGVSQTVATLAAITSPLFTGCVVRNKRADEWRLVLYVAAALYLSGAVFYGMFGSAEKQVWAEEPPCIIKENDCNRRPSAPSFTGHCVPECHTVMEDGPRDSPSKVEFFFANENKGLKMSIWKKIKVYLPKGNGQLNRINFYDTKTRFSGRMAYGVPIVLE
uniref:Major facilitator superfamily (MFS) profile domain-containing protein n=1 Tax=Timema shepardi TaxID=629360 RepID=A0A7R9FXU7_TIMSH|nr:unnamed protein product [Timema shepardi]